MSTRPDCAAIEEWISESLDAPLPDGRRAALARHLQDCASCTAFQIDLESLSLELRPARPELSRVWARLRPALPRSRPRFRGLKVAAALLLAALSYAAGRTSIAPAPAPEIVRPAAPSAAPSNDSRLSDISAQVTVAALVPGAGDPGSVMVEETGRLVAPELVPSRR